MQRADPVLRGEEILTFVSIAALDLYMLRGFMDYEAETRRGVTPGRQVTDLGTRMPIASG